MDQDGAVDRWPVDPSAVGSRARGALAVRRLRGGHGPGGGLADVDAALTAPATGAKVWRNTPGHERMRILPQAADLADQRAEEIGQILSGENGKNITEARGGASRSGQDWQQLAAATLPMGKLGQVDEIADFVVFLLSDRSGVGTGSVIDWDQNVIGGLGD